MWQLATLAAIAPQMESDISIHFDAHSSFENQTSTSSAVGSIIILVTIRLGDIRVLNYSRLIVGTGISSSQDTAIFGYKPHFKANDRGSSLRGMSAILPPRRRNRRGMS